MYRVIGKLAKCQRAHIVYYDTQLGGLLVLNPSNPRDRLTRWGSIEPGLGNTALYISICRANCTYHNTVRVQLSVHVHSVHYTHLITISFDLGSGRGGFVGGKNYHRCTTPSTSRRLCCTLVCVDYVQFTNSTHKRCRGRRKG